LGVLSSEGVELKRRKRAEISLIDRNLFVDAVSEQLYDGVVDGGWRLQRFVV
jgi:hypothetical protein